MIQNYFGWLNMTHDDPYQYDNLKYGLMIFNPTKIIKKTSTLTSWIQDQLRSLAVHVKALSLTNFLVADNNSDGLNTWLVSVKLTALGRKDALKQMGVELIVRGPTTPSVEFCHILAIDSWQCSVDNAQLTIIWQSFWHISVETAWSNVRDQLLHQNSENWGNTQIFSGLLSV